VFFFFFFSSIILDLLQKVQTPADVDDLMPALVEALRREKKTSKRVFRTTYTTMYAFENEHNEEGPQSQTLHFATRIAVMGKFRHMFTTVSLPNVMFFIADS